MTPTPLTDFEHAILFILDKGPPDYTLNALRANCHGITPAQTAACLNRLAKRGLITREGRYSTARLNITAQGRQALRDSEREAA